MPNLTISISDELYTRMEHVRDRLDISRVCEKALAKEIHRLDRKVTGKPAHDSWGNVLGGGGGNVGGDGGFGGDGGGF